MRRTELGTSVVTPPDPLVAGSFTTVSLAYTAGYPVDDSGYLLIAFRNVGDFGAPQFSEPAGPNYCSLHTSGSCQLRPRWDERGYLRPWTRALFIQITAGYLDRGERIEVVFGDQRQGSPGWQVQTFRERSFEFKTLVDPIATFQFKELPESPQLPVVAGPPVHAVCLAPSDVQAGRPFVYRLRQEDLWGNPVGPLQGFEHPGFDQPGVQTVEATCRETGLSARSNPIQASGETTGLRHYWADFHGQSEETVGTNTIEDYFEFARDYGLLDICAHQGNDFQVTDEFWEEVNRVTKRFYRRGVFVTFPGYEWSGNTPLGGDRNVYYKSEGGIITRSSCELLPAETSRYPDSPTARDLFDNLKGPSPFVFAHAGGRYADMRLHEENLEVAVEIHSAWGTFEWLVEEALRRGYRIGICGNSDGHKCRPGASYPGAGEFGSMGGLTCVLAERLDRDAVHAAVTARHFYATTGSRLLLSVGLQASDGRTAIMGDLFKRKGTEILLTARVAPTAPIDRVELRDRSGTVRTFYQHRGQDLGRLLKILWSGAELPGRARMARWDGTLAIRSNRILSAQALNFWNRYEPLHQTGPAGLQWKSATTGGVAGVVIRLEKPEEGEIRLETAQGALECSVASIGLSPRIWRFGGLRKQIELYRLPEGRTATPFEIQFPLETAPAGDNALYLRVVQEDGHMAWSSPIFLSD